MISKRIIAPLLVVILVAGIGGVLTAKKTTERRATQTELGQTIATPEPTATEAPQEDVATEPQATPGRYVDYREEYAQDANYQHTVLFFHASWCPECRAYDQAIIDGGIPANAQILKINYDNASELKRKHGVTLQSTFVSIGQDGSQLKKWVGYGKNKSVPTIFENLDI